MRCFLIGLIQTLGCGFLDLQVKLVLEEGGEQSGGEGGGFSVDLGGIDGCTLLLDKTIIQQFRDVLSIHLMFDLLQRFFDHPPDSILDHIFNEFFLHTVGVVAQIGRQIRLKHLDDRVFLDHLVHDLHQLLLLSLLPQVEFLLLMSAHSSRSA
jgi:hypothetical protein